MINTNSRKFALVALALMSATAAGSAAGSGGSAGATPGAAKADPDVKAMTKAQAAKAVRRPVTELVDGKDDAGNDIKVARTRHVAVRESEVLDFKDYGTHVVVVTEDGQKFSSLDTPAGK